MFWSVASRTFAPNVGVATLDTLDYVAQRDVVGAQLGGVDVDLVLAYPSADAGHLGHAGHGIELGLMKSPGWRAGSERRRPSTVYQKIWPRPVASGARYGYDSLGEDARCQFSFSKNPLRAK